MSSSRGSLSGYADEDEELKTNGKVIKFKNKFCTDSGDCVSTKISESIQNSQRLYHKYEKKTYNFFRLWEPNKREYKIIVREVIILKIIMSW